MNIDDFKNAQAIQVKMLAFKKLKEMLECERVILSSSNDRPGGVEDIFSQIFGEGERRELNESIKKEMAMMVDGKISALESEFLSVG